MITNQIQILQTLVQQLQGYHAEVELQNEELRRARSELEASRDRLAELYHFSPVAQFTLSSAGKVLELNMTAASLLNQEISRVRHKHFLTFLEPESRSHFLAHLHAVTQETTSVHHCCELTMMQHGERRIVRAESVGVPNQSNTVHQIHMVLIDITEQKQAEEKLQNHHQYLEQLVQERTLCLQKTNQQLLASNKAKDQFLALMSHELRTPLNAIITLAGALQEQLQTHVNEKQLKSLFTIEESGQHLMNLINDILELSKIQANKVQLDIVPVYIDELCESCLRLMQDTAQKKQQHLHLNIEDGVKLCHADGRYLRQILVNLLSNAIKFTPVGGDISLRVKAFAAAQTIEFAVCDTGLGINCKDLDKLFQPFTQLDSSLSRQYGGTGLGLSLVRSLVEIHGGKIVVDSKINQGSCFKVLLPWHDDTFHYHQLNY